MVFFMKTNSTSLTIFLALLMAVLTFSHPVVILAQQNSVEIQAKHDAKSDIKELR